MLPRLLRPLIFIWLLALALIGIAVAIGYLLPDGGQMIYTKNFVNTNPRTVSIVVRDTDRHIDHRLTEDFGVNMLANWSPDGNQIAYLSLNDNVFHLYLMDAQGRNKHRLSLEFNTVDSTPSWSPDGKWILVSGNMQGESETILLNVASDQTYVIPQYVVGQMQWTPDSQNIFYQASTENGTSHLFGININCLTHQDSCQFTELDLLSDQAVYSVPVWSPDQRMIAYTTFRANKAVIAIAQLRCTELTASCIERKDIVVDTPLDNFSPIWSPDGKQLAFVSGHYELSFYQLDTGEIRSIVTPGIYPILKDWSPDKKFIAYPSEQTGIGNMYLLDVLSGESQPMLQNQNTAEFPEWRPKPH